MNKCSSLQYFCILGILGSLWDEYLFILKWVFIHNKVVSSAKIKKLHLYIVLIITKEL